MFVYDLVGHKLSAMKKIRFNILIVFIVMNVSCSKLFKDHYTRISEVPMELVYEHEFQYDAQPCTGLISTKSSQMVFLVNDWFNSEIVRLDSDLKLDTVFETQKTLSGIIQSANNDYLVSVERGDYDILDVNNDFSIVKKIDLKLGQYNDPYIVNTIDGFVALSGFGTVSVDKFDFDFNKQWGTEFKSLNGDVCFYDKQTNEILLLTYAHKLIKIDNQSGQVKEMINFDLPKTDIVRKFIYDEGNFYLIAITNQPLDTISDNYIDNNGCCCNDDIDIYKIGGNGKILWNKRFGNPDANDEVNDIILDKNKDIFIAGSWGENNCINQQGWDGNYFDIYVNKISNDGKELGETIMGIDEENEEALHLVSLNGEIYTICYMQETKNNVLKDWLRLYKID